jgi:hypothetical protein
MGNIATLMILNCATVLGKSTIAKVTYLRVYATFYSSALWAFHWSKVCKAGGCAAYRLLLFLFRNIYSKTGNIRKTQNLLRLLVTIVAV